LDRHRFKAVLGSDILLQPHHCKDWEHMLRLQWSAIRTNVARVAHSEQAQALTVCVLVCSLTVRMRWLGWKRQGAESSSGMATGCWGCWPCPERLVRTRVTWLAFRDPAPGLSIGNLASSLFCCISRACWHLHSLPPVSSYCWWLLTKSEGNK
jgi:hypothetical protein